MQSLQCNLTTLHRLFRCVARSVATFAFLTTCNACATSSVAEDGSVRSDVANYKVQTPGAGWLEVDKGGSDAEWYNEKYHASLLVNAQCIGVDEAPLNALTNHLLFGTTDREVLSQEELMVSKRAALESTIDFKLDGVPRRMKALVMKKDGCVYDIVLAAPPETFAAATKGYDRVRSNFDVLAKN